jgi:hypothetical protein
MALLGTVSRFFLKKKEHSMDGADIWTSSPNVQSVNSAARFKHAH